MKYEQQSGRFPNGDHGLVTVPCQNMWGRKKVCEVLDNPEYLISQTHQLVEDLRAGAVNIHQERARIEKEMEALANERQALITWAIDRGKLPPPIWKTN